jgi:hypothetical protein
MRPWKTRQHLWKRTAGILESRGATIPQDRPSVPPRTHCDKRGNVSPPPTTATAACRHCGASASPSTRARSQAVLARVPLRRRGRRNGGARRRGDPCNGVSSRRGGPSTTNPSGGRPQQQQHLGQGAIASGWRGRGSIARRRQRTPCSSPMRIGSLWKPALTGAGARPDVQDLRPDRHRPHQPWRQGGSMARDDALLPCTAHRAPGRTGTVSPSRSDRPVTQLCREARPPTLRGPPLPRRTHHPARRRRSPNAAAQGHVPALPRSPLQGHAVRPVPEPCPVPAGSLPPCERSRRTSRPTALGTENAGSSPAS